MTRRLPTLLRRRLLSGMARCASTVRDDRGDVPGWVLVTIMTAGLVAGLWAVAGETLNELFTSAIRGTAGGP